MRLNPRFPMLYRWVEGQSLFFLGQHEAATAAFEDVVDRNPEFARGHLMLAASLAVLGRQEDARMGD